MKYRIILLIMKFKGLIKGILKKLGLTNPYNKEMRETLRLKKYSRNIRKKIQKDWREIKNGKKI